MDKRSLHNLNIAELVSEQVAEEMSRQVIAKTDLQQSWQQFENDCMTDEERIAFLEQLLDDEEEMSRLTSLELAEMPRYLEEEILQEIFAQENSGVEVRNPNSRPPKWLQLFSYSVKIAFAAACAIIALFRMPEISTMNRLYVDGVQGDENISQQGQKVPGSQDALKWEQEALEREIAALEREQENLAREAEAAKRQQEVMAQMEQRRQQSQSDGSYIANAFQFITSKIFVGGIEND